MRAETTKRWAIKSLEETAQIIERQITVLKSHLKAVKRRLRYARKK